MTSPHAPCLGTGLVRRLVPLQAAMFAALALLVVGTLWATGCLLAERDEDQAIDVLQQAIERSPAGGLALRATPELAALRAEAPDLWFVIRDAQGHTLSEGTVPQEFARIGDALDQVSQARLGWQLLHDDPRKPAARLKRVESAAGDVQIMTATQGSMSASKAVRATSTLFLSFVLPSVLLMTLATLIATPIVVHRVLAGLDDAADQARQIDFGKRGTRLPVASVPTEITPLVTAVNDALARLDEGYSRHQRFVANAAHELRTPIAILNTRLEALPQSAEKIRLLEDVGRLAILAEQLLDIQRLDQSSPRFDRVDLVAIGRRVAADLAPIAIAAGYDISFEPETARVDVFGDQASLERALTNLVQNAIQHGDRHGTISIRVSASGSIDVSDQGGGIPPDQRKQIFEPFYRLRPRDHGAGLGLNLVREIVRLHRGEVAALDGPHGGARLRMSFPPLSPAQ
ncbi:HAMP domain-containing sensor histidine kinase [Bradyrhizobium sp. LHD-71]|uniref:sensor histidine kinase n=1 Tax=Bradyrhizobium sp. LHD-71 TaxID=3072141 RepID=UPI00280F2CBA|nr:HAMP domain-containing sensor histidine kinase [Bradyrhizobium sp. LHD-71]MDQ8729368.1 HAMP domain-containing sensor histidine kinase [Bradyrhizobium sp. LHD-71]